jgi:hypothetical protein
MRTVGLLFAALVGLSCASISKASHPFCANTFFSSGHHQRTLHAPAIAVYQPYTYLTVGGNYASYAGDNNAEILKQRVELAERKSDLALRENEFLRRQIAGAPAKGWTASGDLRPAPPRGEPVDEGVEPAFVAIAREYCVSCHGEKPKGNKLALFNAEGRMHVLKQAGKDALQDRLLTADPDKVMPPAGAKQPPVNDRMKFAHGVATLTVAK